MAFPWRSFYFAILVTLSFLSLRTMMNSLRTPFGFPRFSTSIASDPEAQRQATFADRRTIVNFPKPVPLRPCARGTISALPFDSTPTRSAVNTYFAISSPTFSRGTIYSRHDRPPAPSRLLLPDNLPPPYEYPPSADLTSEDEDARLPSYSEHIGPCDDDKPFLLAKFLFKYGFGRCLLLPPHYPNIGPFVVCFCAVFPPFWFLSTLILLIPLTPPPTWELDKSPVERATLLRHTRATECLWARRGLCAAGIFSGLVTLTVAIFMVAMHAT
ncbi:hypothetical protein EDB85DRAFT_1939011 [Lactarius pseudohatsudake]|nr:hypothetical protein EDB85DRAFT_1939011 [Lactarius pseudohatsudake]